MEHQPPLLRALANSGVDASDVVSLVVTHVERTLRLRERQLRHLCKVLEVDILNTTERLYVEARRDAMEQFPRLEASIAELRSIFGDHRRLDWRVEVECEEAANGILLSTLSWLRLYSVQFSPQSKSVYSVFQLLDSRKEELTSTKNKLAETLRLLSDLGSLERQVRSVLVTFRLSSSGGGDSVLDSLNKLADFAVREWDSTFRLQEKIDIPLDVF